MTSLTLFCDICTSVETGYTSSVMEVRCVERLADARLCREARAKRTLAREFYGVEFSTY